MADFEINIYHPKILICLSKRCYRKYAAFCTILDYLSYLEGVSSIPSASIDGITSIALRNYFFRTKKNRVEVKTWIAELNWMGLIKNMERKEGTEIYLTDKGKEVYSNQVFHLVFSNLQEARESRVVAIIAMLIAIVSLFYSIIGN